MTKVFAGAALLLFGLPGWLSAGARLREPRPYHIVVPSRPLQPGETILARLEPEPPPEAYVTWRFAPPEGLHRNWTATKYRAPYVVQSGHPPIQLIVEVETESWRQTVTTTVELARGSVPGAEDCLGPDQTFSELSGDIIDRGCTLDDIPHVIRAEPIYPRSSFARGSEDTIHVHALVCKNGFVLDAYAPPIYRNLHEPPEERDPKLLAAAVEAVRRSEFGSGTCARWWSIPVLFHR